MNAKKNAKHGGRASKFKMNQPRKVTEGKSNIAVKRVTLLPGFLINGFTSTTAKKTKDKHPFNNKSKKRQTTNNNFLTENLQAFLERKANLRRSQRILKMQKKANDLDSSRNYFNNDSTDLPSTSSSSPNPSSIGFKSILKKNSKSIFKEISDKFSKVNTENSISEELLSNEFIIEKQPNIQKEIPSPNMAIVYNKSICQDFFRKIHVTFSKNAIKECREKIKREINVVNLILTGKMQREETVSSDVEESDSESKETGTVLPIPPKNWVYSTPSNQKVSVPAMEESKLKPGIIFMNKNSNFYEDPDHINKRPMANCEHNKMTTNALRDDFQNRNHTLGPRMHNLQLTPSFLNRHLPNHSNYFPNMPEQENPLDFHDFTFIEEGGNFKIEESQSNQRTKRPLGGNEEYLIKKICNTGHSKCEKSNMFNFNCQERNVFDFSGVM